MSDIETRLRRVLTDQATSVDRDSHIPDSVFAGVERRRRRRSTVLAGAAVIALAVVGTSIALVRDGSDGVHVATQPGGPTPTPTTAASRPGAATTPPPTGVPIDASAFIDGKLVDLSAVPPSQVGAFPAAVAPHGPPVRTPFGLVAALGETNRATLWLLSDRGEPLTKLADSVAGFAVSGDGRTVAWSEVQQSSPSDTRSVLATASLPDGRRGTSTTTVAGVAIVKGFAASAVLLNTGDGARSRVAVWLPASGRVIPAGAELGSVAATFPGGDRVVLNEGDGICGVLGRVLADGTVDRTVDGQSRPCSRALAFSPDGARIAAADASRASEAVVLGADGRELLRWTTGGQVLQAQWLDNGQVALLSRLSNQRYAVTMCDVAVPPCTAVWQTDAAFETQRAGAGSIWLFAKA